MTVAQLIELLKTCDQGARVVVSMEPLGEEMLMQNAREDVEALEIGWVDKIIESDLTFSLRPIGGYLEPAVRILGGNHKPTNPDAKIIYNGLEAMKDVQIVPIKRLP